MGDFYFPNWLHWHYYLIGFLNYQLASMYLCMPFLPWNKFKIYTCGADQQVGGFPWIKRRVGSYLLNLPLWSISFWSARSADLGTEIGVRNTPPSRLAPLHLSPSLPIYFSLPHSDKLSPSWLSLANQRVAYKKQREIHRPARRDTAAGKSSWKLNLGGGRVLGEGFSGLMGRSRGTVLYDKEE